MKLLTTQQLILSSQEDQELNITIPINNVEVKEVDPSCGCSSVDIKNNLLTIKIKKLTKVEFQLSDKDYQDQKYYIKNVSIDFVLDNSVVETLSIKIYVYEND